QPAAVLPLGTSDRLRRPGTKRPEPRPPSGRRLQPGNHPGTLPPRSNSAAGRRARAASHRWLENGSVSLFRLAGSSAEPDELAHDLVDDRLDLVADDGGFQDFGDEVLDLGEAGLDHRGDRGLAGRRQLSQRALRSSSLALMSWSFGRAASAVAVSLMPLIASVRFVNRLDTSVLS